VIECKTLHYSSSVALVRGLRELKQQGVRGRGLLFLALNERGEALLAIAQDLSDGAKIKVGQKLTLDPPFHGRVFYFDAVHPVGHRAAIVNGDRRIGNVANLVDAAALVSGYVEDMDGESVFFGCTPHQPGSWLIQDTQATALHEGGFVEILPLSSGLVARRTMDDGLYHLPADSVQNGGHWLRVFESPLGNILLLERRTKRGRLVLSCRRGLIEVDLNALPRVKQVAAIELAGGFAVLGRITDGGFAVSRGLAKEWGFDELGPATILGTRNTTLKSLGRLLSKHPDLI
jgi:hypothetical protein